MTTTHTATKFLELNATWLAGFEHQLDLDIERISTLDSVTGRRLYTYLFTYPHLVAYFSAIDELDVSSFVIGKAIAYSLMPTTMNLRQSSIAPLMVPLNRLKQDGHRLETAELIRLKTLVNNSIVGTSKLLHFIRPDIYPIWDSRIDRFIHGEDRDTNSVERYQTYLASFDRIAAEPIFSFIHQSMENKLGYQITKARAFEMVMYLADLHELSFESPSKPVAVKPEVVQPRPVSVPIYKRDAYTFISNLGPVTIDPANPKTLIRNGYLLSERYTTNPNLSLATIARRRRKLLISDNGNWTRMSTIARQFDQAGSTILEKARAELNANGDISLATRAERDALMEEIAQACSNAVDKLNLSQIIETQLRMSPHYIIGLEDFTIPVLMMVGLMDPIFSPDSAEIIPYQQRTASLFERQVAGEFGFLHELNHVGMYLVVHAFDYNSAFAGGQAARAITKDGLAISYGAPMRSRRWITEIALGNSVEDLGENLPESYIVAHALTIGVANGHGGDIPIHILGVGTPILIMMIGYLLKHTRAVSIDSSAPLKDAFDGVIYGSRQAYLKMRMYRVAALALIDDVPYESKTAFFRAFHTRYPDDWSGLRDKLGVTPRTDLRELESTLETRQDLVRKHIPFFTRLTSNDDPFFWDLRVSRAGHNYCVLREIVDHIRRRKNNWPALNTWTEREINRYAAVASPKWARALEKSYELIVKHRLVDI
jgi:hypothetical protein